MNKSEPDIRTVKLKKGHDERLQAGHPWIFSNELESVDTAAEPGCLVKVLLPDGKTAGTGFFNPKSLIAVRMLKTGPAPLEPDFTEKTIERALEHRRDLGLTGSFRVFFGESDGIGGLVLDKYGDTVVAEIISAGAERLKPEITAAVRKLLSPSCLYFKNTHVIRELEGLPRYAEAAFGALPDEMEIEENGLKFVVSLKDGQKTGWFFDQRENRTFLAPWFQDRKVLDLYTYTGAFALNAAAAGARMAWGVDSSQTAIDTAEKNAALNGMSEKVFFRKENAERLIAAMGSGDLPEKPDFVLLDPPNLVRNRKNLPQARKLYVKLNASSIAALPAGGLLATSTCSHHINRETFVGILKEACGRSRRRVVLLELRGQAKDHPVLPVMPETEYLHFALLKVF
ncbi:MAG: 23S rRNA (cytosine1962-C5)-methyltransferase [Elusimicrobia bacterium]|nr:MAG: 23S rRNA (cytosine1962-C5)-methyltransferase [Elusimicrobiota bacterium]KAF0157128.1 MAG: 23S rRNA (cytosine1962-C5)-methyltransferase [Elusimicrobiota bacterium]